MKLLLRGFSLGKWRSTCNRCVNPPGRGKPSCWELRRCLRLEPIEPEIDRNYVKWSQRVLLTALILTWIFVALVYARHVAPGEPSSCTPETEEKTVSLPVDIERMEM